MSDYKVMLTPRAVKDMDEIYRYILEEFREQEQRVIIMTVRYTPSNF